MEEKANSHPRGLVSRRNFWRNAAVLFVASWSGGSFAAPGTEGTVSPEHEIKAAFIYNFMKFAEWPATKFANTNSAIFIGVAGKGPLLATLEATVKGRTIYGRTIVVKAVTNPASVDGVHLLCFSGFDESRLREALVSLKGKSILTVGDSEKFSDSGGMITFVPEGDRMRFEINIGAVEEEGLKLTAQLLKLAKTVRRRK